jgi:hypothetical protein
VAVAKKTTTTKKATTAKKENEAVVEHRSTEHAHVEEKKAETPAEKKEFKPKVY